MTAYWHPDACTVANTRASDVPAETTYLPNGWVRVTHPLGDDHPNAVLARERAALRGRRVIPPKTMVH